MLIFFNVVKDAFSVNFSAVFNNLIIILSLILKLMVKQLNLSTKSKEMKINPMITIAHVSFFFLFPFSVVEKLPKF